MSGNRITIKGIEALRKGKFQGTALSERGRITLKQADPSQTGSESSYLTFGTYTYEVALPPGSGVSEVVTLSPDLPVEEKTPTDKGGWPSVATDLITQVRFLQPDGKWTPCQPRNLLTGGDFADQNRNGLPDWTSLMQLRSGGMILFTDSYPVGSQAPSWNWWHGKEQRQRGNFVDKRETPPGASQSLRLERHTSKGQDTPEMRKDLVPPETTLTVSGWNRYDLGDQTSMGVMARFHEFNAEGDRINKYVLLGDDDFHQPTGRSSWRWRALTFTTMSGTVRLGIYPIRMITAQGRAWSANWEVREGSVYSGWGNPKAIFRETFHDLNGWELSHPAMISSVKTGYSTSHSLVMKPPPLAVATAIQKNLIPIQEGKLYAFRVAMQNDTSAKYEPTHETWVSCYLEFLDADKRIRDYVKAMVFRPVLQRPVGAAMVAPPASKFARFRLVASHITYGERQNITGAMTASFSALQLEESAYDATWIPRPPGAKIKFSVPVRATKMQIRSWLLSRDRRVTPSLGGYSVNLVRL